MPRDPDQQRLADHCETHSALGIQQRHHALTHQACRAAGEQVERLLQGGIELHSLNNRGRFRQTAELLPDPALGLRPALEFGLGY